MSAWERARKSLHSLPSHLRCHFTLFIRDAAEPGNVDTQSSSSETDMVWVVSLAPCLELGAVSGSTVEQPAEHRSKGKHWRDIHRQALQIPGPLQIATDKDTRSNKIRDSPFWTLVLPSKPCLCSVQGLLALWKSFPSRKKVKVKSCLTLCDPMDGSLPGSFVHGISQARILVWVAISFSRGSSRPRD